MANPNPLDPDAAFAGFDIQPIASTKPVSPDAAFSQFDIQPINPPSEPELSPFQKALRVGQEPEVSPETGRAALQAIGGGLDLEGQVAKGAVQDVASTARRTYRAVTGNPSEGATLGENTIAAARGQETPFTAETKDVGGWQEIVQNVAESAAHMAPAMMITGGLEAAGVPAAAAAGTVFGFNKDGFDPKQAVLLGLAPIVGGWGAAGAMKIAQGVGARLATSTAAALRTVGSWATTQAYFDLISTPEYLSLPPEERWKKWAEQAGLNLALHLPQIPGLAAMKLNERTLAKNFQQSVSVNSQEHGPVSLNNLTVPQPQEANVVQEQSTSPLGSGQPTGPAAPVAEGIAGQDFIPPGARSGQDIAAPAAAEIAPLRAEAQQGETPPVETPKSSTQLTLKPVDAAPVISFANSIPKKDIYSKKDASGKEDFGRETEPHITALYGLTDHVPEPVASEIANHGPVTVTLGKTSVFENPDYDVLKVEATGQALHDLNGKLVKLPNENTFPDYKPHMTIAYLKKGTGKKYAGDARFEGKQITFDTLTFSPPQELRGQIGRPELPLSPNVPNPVVENAPIETAPRTLPAPAAVERAAEVAPVGAVLPARSPAEILNAAAKVTIKGPEGATQIRVTNPKGQVSVQPISSVNKGSNIFRGVDVSRIEAGTIDKTGKFKPLKGPVEVIDRAQPKQPNVKPVVQQAPANANQLDVQQAGVRPAERPAVATSNAETVPAVPPAQAKTGGVNREGFFRGRPPDIIDNIQSAVGELLSRTNARAGHEGYYTEEQSYLENNSTLKRLFSKTGSAPDDALSQLKSSGLAPDNWDVSDMWQAIGDALDSRKSWYQQASKEKAILDTHMRQDTSFAKDSVKLRNKPDKADELFPETLTIGTRFEIGGHHFVVRDIYHNEGKVSQVVVTDDEKFGEQELRAGQPIYPDKGSIKFPKREAPPEKPPLVMEKPESVDEQKARLAAEADVAAKQAEREKIAALQAKPLTGTVGDIGQTDMFAPPDLFSRSQGPSGTPEAAYLHRQAIVSPETPQSRHAALAWHEIAVHGGIESVARLAGAEGDPMRKAIEASSKFLLKEADAIAQAGGYKNAAALISRYRFDVNTPEGRQAYVAELMARKAEELVNKPKPSWWRDLLGRVQVWFAKKFGVTLSENGVEALIRSGMRDMQGHELEVRAIPTAEGIDISYSLAETPEKLRRQEELRQPNVRAVTGASFNEPAQIVSDITRDLSPGAKRMAGEPFLAGMARAVADINAKYFDTGKTTYAEAIAAAGDNIGLRTEIQKGAEKVIQAQQSRRLRALDARDKQLEVTSSPAFLNRVDRMVDADITKDALAGARDTFRNQIKQDVARTMAELESRTNLSATEEQLRAELRRLKGMGNYSEAVTHAVDDIALVLSATPDGLFVLRNPTATPREIADAYQKELVNQGYDKIQRGEDRAPLIGLAASVLAANRDVRSQLTAVHEAQRDPALKADVSRFGKQVRNALAKEPAKAVELILGRSEKLTVEAERARQVWKLLNRSVTKELTKLADSEAAVNAFDAIERSQAWRDWVAQVQKDTGGIQVPENVLRGEQKRAEISSEFRTEGSATAPDGTKLEFNLGHTPEEAAQFYSNATDHLGKIQTWLDDPTNADSPYRAYWQRESDAIRARYYNSVVSQPTSIRPFILNHSWFIPDYFFDQVQLPAAKVTRQSLENLGQAANFSGGWFQKHVDRYLRRVIGASQSHGFDVAQGNQQWQDHVLNWMGWASRNGQKLRAGDRLNNGVVLTPQDIEAFQYLGGAANEVFTGVRNLGREGLMDDRLLFTQYGNRVLGLRMPLEIGREAGTTLPASFSQRGIDLAKLASKAKSLDELESLLNSDQNWEFVQSFLSQRKADYIKTLSPFESLYRELSAKIKSGASDAPRSIQDIVDFLEANSTDEIRAAGVKEQFLGEISDLLGRFQRTFLKEKTPGAPDVTSKEAESSFTKAFESEVMPSFFYDYGASTAAGLRDMATDSTGWHVERMIYSLDSLYNTISKSLYDLTKAGKAGRKGALAANKSAHFSGEDFRDYQRLEDQLTELDRFRKLAKTWYGEATVEAQVLQANEFRRLIGDRIEAALGGLTTLGHITYGSTLKQGMVFSAMDNGLVSSTSKALASLGVSLFKIVPRAILHDLGRVLVNSPSAAAALANTPGGWRPRVAESARRWLEGVGENVVSMSKYLRDQSALNMVVNQTASDRLFNIIMQPSSRGRGYEPTESGPVTRLAKNAYYNLLSAAEVPLELFKTWFPSLGYSVIYDAAARQAGWEIRMLEQSARRAFNTHEKLGTLGTFDLENPSNPQNKLTADILPRSLFPKTQVSLNLAREWFRAIDLPFNEAVLTYWKKLSATPEAERNSVRMLWGGAEGEQGESLRERRELALAAVALRDVHHGGVTNRSWFIRQYPGVQMIAPFVGWGTQSVRQLPSLLGIAPHDPRFSRAVVLALWATTIMGTAGVMALHGDILNWLRSKITELGYNQKQEFRHIWEGRDAKETAKLATSSVFAHIALADSFVNKILGLHQGRGGLTWQPMALSEVTGVIDLLKGMIGAGDLTYGLTQFVSQNMPLSKVVLNRLPSTVGTRDERNVEVTLRKYGPQENQREPGTEAPVPTALSPVRDKLRNDVFTGNTTAIEADHQAYVAAAVQMGKTADQAEQSFRQTFEQLSPTRRVFGGNLTADQRQATVSQMDAGERQQFEQIEGRWAQAAQALGFPASTERTAGGSKSGSGGSAGNSGSANSSGTSGGRLGRSSGGLRGLGLRGRSPGLAQTVGTRGQRRFRLATPSTRGIRSRRYGRTSRFAA